MHVTRTRRAPRLALAGTALALLAACGGGAVPTLPGGIVIPSGAPVTDLTKLCDLLGPADFTAAGIPGAGTPTVSSDGPGSAYCVYAGTSGATGGIELDVFVGDDAEETYQTVLDESPATDPLTIPGVDAAEVADGTAGQADGFATIIVRKGNLVFAMSAPGGPGVSAKLAALAAVVVARGSGLIG
jgi:hypothetical protein